MSSSIRTSVVIPAYKSWSTLPAVLDSLAPQVNRPDRELVVIDSSGETLPPALDERWPWARFLAVEGRLCCGQARNTGLAAVSGAQIAFIDADAIPGPRWLDELEEAMTDSSVAVAGPVLNGTTHSAIGTADYVVTFSDFLPSRSKPPLHAAGCNMLMRRDALQSAGGFKHAPGEDTILTFPLSRAGGLAFAPRAGVRHLNRTTLRMFLSHQRSLGRGFRRASTHVPLPSRLWSRPMLAPLAAPLRLVAINRRLLEEPRLAFRAATLLPLLLLGLCAWAVGVAEGSTVAGSPNCPCCAKPGALAAA